MQRALLTNLCKVVVVTMGASGAWGLTAADQIYQPAEVVSVVDSVGAGDCFFAGSIAALICGGAIATLRGAAPSQPTLARALRRATRCAAINVTRQGCQSPTWVEAASTGSP